MRKFLLVTFIGMVLAINIYGIVTHFKVDDIQEVDHVEETTTAIYVE